MDPLWKSANLITPQQTALHQRTSLQSSRARNLWLDFAAQKRYPIRVNNDDAIQEAWLQAWRFAARAHGGQVTPGEPFPYVVHLGAVGMEILAAHRHAPFADAPLAVQCALLHDTLEDTKTQFAEIEAAFGPKVAAGVLALTKNSALPKERKMADSLERIAGQPAEVQAVKLADRITNLQVPPAPWTAAKIADYREEARAIHAALHQAHRSLGARLQRKIDAYPPRA